MTTTSTDAPTIIIMSASPHSAAREWRREIERLDFNERGWEAASEAVVTYPLRAMDAMGSPGPRYYAILCAHGARVVAQPAGPWPGSIDAAMQWATERAAKAALSITADDISLRFVDAAGGEADNTDGYNFADFFVGGLDWMSQEHRDAASALAAAQQAYRGADVDGIAVRVLICDPETGAIVKRTLADAS